MRVGAVKDQGMDSLMAVEVRTRVRRDLNVLLPVGRILSGATITDLVADLVFLESRTSSCRTAGRG